jgi:RNA polymerase sigma-70 factor (ECF subfamily)
MVGVGRGSDSVETDGTVASTERFEALYERHVRAMTAYCARRLPDDQVDDGVADTFLVVWRRIDDVPDGDAERLWMYRVAHRVVGHAWRSSQRRRRLTSRVGWRPPVRAAGPEESAVDGDDVRRVLAAAERLKPTDAEVLRLFVWERLGAGEIAAVLEITPNAVHQRLHRAKQHLVREYNATGSRHLSAATETERGGAQ